MDKTLQMVKENIDLLNRQAWDHRVSDSGQAEVLSREAIELSKSIGYTNGHVVQFIDVVNFYFGVVGAWLLVFIRGYQIIYSHFNNGQGS